MARKRMTFLLLVALSALGVGVAVAQASSGAKGSQASAQRHDNDHSGSQTATPIKHIVVIFQENVSFDHYFATYPHAANPPGEPQFHPSRGTPSVNGLNESLQAPNNPNSVQPFRFDRSQYQTSSQDHGYTHEQQAFDHGLMDMFVERTGRTGPPGPVDAQGHQIPGGQVMGYYDGNTVTAMWNYAQHFSMSDNSFSTGFGPSTVGALNLVSGQTHGFSPDANPASNPPTTSGSAVTANTTVIGDPQPAGDICDNRDRSTSIDPNNKNIGDLLNSKGVTWGWFQGGFRNCTQSHTSRGGQTSIDYIPHHEPFQYYRSTQNLQHTPPASVAEIGHNGQANHQYDLTDFWSAVDAGNMPAVSFLKAAAYQDGHAGYSNPLDEQDFLVNTINRLEKSPDWSSTAVVIAYDDSDGWYDHQMGPIVNQSQDPSVDALRGTDCGLRSDPQHTLGTYQDRCGYGPRQPLLVISPFAKHNYVDHSTTDQTSILRFIEDNWGTGRIGNYSMDTKAGSLRHLFSFGRQDESQGNRLFLDPNTGEPAGGGEGRYDSSRRH